MPFVENVGKEVRTEEGGGEVVILSFFCLLALVSYVGITIYTVYTFIQASHFFTTRTTQREENEEETLCFFFFSSLNSSSRHQTLTSQQKIKKKTMKEGGRVQAS